MITIKNSSYSNSDLKQICSIKAKDLELDSWEHDFWLFVQEWFSDEAFIVVNTSGSTGKPKKIKHLKKYCKASAKMTCIFFNLNANSNALLCLPITSIGGKMMFIRALEAGFDLKVQKPSANPLQDINAQFDFVAIVPYQVQQATTYSPEKWKLINTIIIGGGKLSNRLVDWLKTHKVNAYSTFGMTETISHIALNKIGEDTIYSALPNIHFTINDENCLQISAPELGLAHLQTNDVVNLINSEQFEWLGRNDDAIESGGYKFLPSILEQKITKLIDEAFFISAVPDEKLNNKLVLVLEANESLISMQQLKKVFSKYECPKEIYCTSSFVRLHSGKIDKKETLRKIIEKD